MKRPPATLLLCLLLLNSCAATGQGFEVEEDILQGEQMIVAILRISPQADPGAYRLALTQYSGFRASFVKRHGGFSWGSFTGRVKKDFATQLPDIEKIGLLTSP